ncbi:hypothetical protein D3C76_635430 [compost metagenome]
MTTPSSLTSNRTPFGKYLIRVAGRAGRLVNQLEARVMHSPILTSVPFRYRRVSMQVFKLILLLAVASVASFLAIGMLAVWTIAALPLSYDRQPRIHEVSHPQHQSRYPEMYDDDGAPR